MRHWAYSHRKASLNPWLVKCCRQRARVSIDHTFESEKRGLVLLSLLRVDMLGWICELWRGIRHYCTYTGSPKLICEVGSHVEHQRWKNWHMRLESREACFFLTYIHRTKFYTSVCNNWWKYGMAFFFLLFFDQSKTQSNLYSSFCFENWSTKHNE